MRRRGVGRAVAAVLLVLGVLAIGASEAGANPAGEISIAAQGLTAVDITTGADGNLWVVDAANDAIVRVTPAGVVTSFKPTGLGSPRYVTTGADGNVWFSDPVNDRVGFITPAGAITTYTAPEIVDPRELTLGGDGNVWFLNGTSLGQITPAGAVVKYTTVHGGFAVAALAITTGPDGSIWYATRGRPLGSSTTDTYPLVIGKRTMAGVVTLYQNTPTAWDPTDIAVTADENVWVTTEISGVHLDPAGTITSVTVPRGWIDVGIDGNLWGGDGATGIARVSPTGTALPAITSPKLFGPTGLAVGPDGATWLSNGPSVARLAADNSVTTFSVNGMSNPGGLALGSDGNMWFTNTSNNSIGRATPAGVVSNFTGTGIDRPNQITAGPDGALWFTNLGNNSIGRITTAGVVSNFTGTGVNKPEGITTGPDGNLWFTNGGGNSIGRITPAGVVSRFTGPAISKPGRIVAGSDGNLWFTNADSTALGRITTAGVASFVSVSGLTFDIAAGPDGNLWVTMSSSQVGRVTPAGVVTRFTDPNLTSPTSIAVGADGNLWVTTARPTYPGVPNLLRVTTAGVFTAFMGVTTIYTNFSNVPADLAAAPDGNLWFTTGLATDHAIRRLGVGTPVVPTSAAVTVAANVSTSVYRQPVTLTANVSLVPGGSVPATGTVTFKDGSTTLGTAPIYAGLATFTTTALGVGSHGVTAVYDGNATVPSTSSAPITQVVNKADTTTVVSSNANPSVWKQPVTLSATVTAVAPSSGSPSANITFLDNGVLLGVAPLVNGVANLTVGTLTTGGHTITATFAGGTNFNGSTSANFAQTVNKGASQATLTASPNPSLYSRPVTLTATVTGVAPSSGSPGATVTFTDNGVPIGTASLLGGTATFVTSALSGGSHNLAVVYAGGVNYLPSTSPTVTQVVTKADTAIDLTSTGSPTSPGQPVTFTATIAAVAPATGAPASSIVFKDGTTTLASVPITAGKATFTTSSLGLGSHSITATFTGGLNYAASVSPALGHTVS